MRRLLALTLMLFTLCGCGGASVSPPPPESSPAKTPDGAASGMLVTEEFWEFPREGDPPLLIADAVFPLLDTQGKDGPLTINSFYEDEKESFFARCEQLYEDALERYDENGQSIPTECRMGFTVEYNQNGRLSIKRELYKYTGGAAHGETLVFCDSFDTETGRRLYLEDVLSGDFAPRLAAAVASRIAEHPEDYYPDYELLALECLPYDSFCLTPDGIALFYPALTVAPLMSGVVRFDISFDEMG